jgi:class 3 adenylate cyclase
MQCASCGFDNREGTRFCVECGTPLATRCPACRAEAQPGQKFCGECGTALTGAPATAPAEPSAVRKTVTVLFADLGGSTGFGERTDAEIARQVLARYHALLQETIDAHAGTVAKFMGDGMMATFGIPEVAEDDARRAVAAGVALQQRFEAFAADVVGRHGETLTLRIGINTGEVVIGEGDADLVGDALNVAARLEKACRPGHVLVGEETWRLTRGDVPYEALGEVTVAGRAEPVAIYEVAVDTEAEPEVATPFVGRDAEMQRLIGVFDDARQAMNARLVTVLGSPGVGKTRLSRELGARLADRAGARCVELRCDRAGGATFEPVAQLVRDAAGLNDDLDADASRAAIGALLATGDADRERIVDALTGLVGVGPARSVEETFWGVRRLIEATAAEQPLIVVIDDIQWAEPLLLDLIEHLAEWVADAAVLLVGLARPELREVRPSLAEPGRPVAAVVVLDGLDSSATEALAAGLLGTERLPAGLVERLPESTDGNPLFVRELVRMLVDDRVVRRGADGEWELTIDAEAVEVPPTIQSLLGARVERLPAAERELLEHASVVGAEFSLGAVRELAGEHAPVASLLEHMRRKELVEPTGSYAGDQPVYRFHHVLIRDAAYRRLLKTTRAELHERIAVWTDRTAADLAGEHEAATAFHYEQAYRYRSELSMLDDDTARLGRRAAELLATAAQRALGRDDLASAGALSARALALRPESDGAARADLLQMGCECLLAAGNGAAARPLVEELGRSAAGDPRLAAWAECYAAQLVGLTDPDGLVAADAQAQAAAGALTALGDGSGQAKAHQVRASLLGRLGRIGECELELDLALAAARAADDRRRVTAVLGAAPDAALFGPSPVPRAGGRCLDVVRLLRITTASPAVEAASNRCQAVLESLRGRFDVSRSMLASAREALEELGLRHGLAQTELYTGMVELIAGHPHAAIAPLRAAFGGLGALGVGADAGNAAALLARALLVDGNVDEADEMATASEQLAGQNLKTAIGWRVARAEVLAARGDLAGAVAIAEQAVEIAAGTDLVIDHADACAALATLRARAGDAAGARAARADARRLYEQKGATVPAERLVDDVSTAAAEPAPASPPAAPTHALRIENTASRAHARAIRAIASDAVIADMYAPEFQYDDRRPVIGAGEHDRDGALDILELTREEGQELDPPTVIAIRGDRLALSWLTTHWSSGNEQRSIDLVEVDEQGRLLAYVGFGEFDLVVAIDELDARYLAGEGAEHTVATEACFAWFRAMNTRDLAAVGDLASDEFVCVDHRHLGWATLDKDAFMELTRQYDDVEQHFLATDVRVRGRASLATVAVNVTSSPGDDSAAWGYHAVGLTGPDGRTVRIEVFAEDDWDAALARFDELSGTAAHAPRVENTASRVWARAVPAILSGATHELAELFAPAYRYDDRRPIVNMGEHDRAGAAKYLALTLTEDWELDALTPVAVRGERLALLWHAYRTPNGYEFFAAYSVVEIDERGRLVAGVTYGDADLAAAEEELDARYLAGEGAPHAELLRAHFAGMRVFQAQDFARVREQLAPDFVWVDHRELSWGTLDVDGFIAQQETYADLRHSYLSRTLRVAGRAVLTTLQDEATSVDGTETHWVFHAVATFDTTDRCSHMEIFAEDDWDAALARFDELSAADPCTPRVENAARQLGARFLALTSAGRFEDAAALLAPNFERVDHTTLPAPPVHGPAEYLAWIPTVYEHFDSVTMEPIAVRGETLSLTRLRLATDDGFESVLLGLGELDDEGRLAWMAHYNEDALADALAELDERYLAGEGAEHRDVLRTAVEFDRAFRADQDAAAALFAPDFVLDDHRRLYYGRGDLAHLTAARRASDETGLDVVATVNREVFVAGRTILTLQHASRRAQDGRDFEWTAWLIASFDSSLLLQRLEYFDEEDRDEALARFDELGRSDPRTPRVENTATRNVDHLFDAIRAGRWDDAGALLAAAFVRVDNRTGVADATTVGPDAYLAAFRSAVDVGFTTVATEHLAVRGDRLSLLRSTFRTDTGSELVIVSVYEIDADARGVHLSLYDPDDLVAAIEELDARHRELAGGTSSPETMFLEGIAAMNRRDWDGFAAHLAPDFVLVDHQPLSFGTTDGPGTVDVMRSMADVMTDAVVVAEKTFESAGATLAAIKTTGRTPEGSGYEWQAYFVVRNSNTGVTDRAESFPADQWDAALACFDDLSAADPRTPRAENAASRCAGRIAQLFTEGRFEACGALIAENAFTRDRRSIIGTDLVGRAAHVADLEAIAALGDRNVEYEPLAVRGSTLAVGRLTSDFADWDSSLLALSELDADGRVISAAYFDEEALDDALMELDERYLAGEGAEHADLLRRFQELTHAFIGRDLDALRALLAPDARFVEHRPLGLPDMDVDAFIEMLRAYTDVETTSMLVPKIHVADRVLLVTYEFRGSGPDGDEGAWGFHAVYAFDGTLRQTRSETYGEDDFAAALARFDELAAQATPTSPEIENTATRLNAAWVEAKNAGRSADLEHLIAPSYIVVSHRFGAAGAAPPGPEIENAATRSMARFPELARARRFDAMADLIAHDYVRVDHRQGIPAPTSHGPDDFVAMIRATLDVGFDDIHNTPLAVRGERLALSRVDVRASDGREIVFLQVHEWRASKLAYAAHYDEGDLVGAIAALDDRYRASGSLTAAEDDALALVAALNRRDWDAYTAGLSPDFVAIDHSPLGFPPAGRAEFVEQQIQGLVALVPDVVVVPCKLVAFGDTVLMTFRTIGTTVDGNRYEWTPTFVARGADGLVERLEAFPAEDWDAALARFDELAAAALEPATTTADSYAQSNRAVRCAHAYDDAYAAQDWDRIAASYHEDVLNDDRRTAVSSGVTIGRDGLLELVRGLVDVGFTTVAQTPIALRGEALALVRRTFEAESGSCLELVAVIEYDEQDRMTANVMFDLDDRAAALQELEDRSCAGEGSDDAYLIRRAGDLVRSMASLDGAATLALVHPDVRFTDHRRLGLGDMGFDGIRGVLAARAEDTSADRSYFRELVARRSTCLGRLWSAGIEPDGDVGALYEFYWVARWVAGKMHDIDWYDLDDVDAARARFEELAAADSRTPHVDNAVVRKLATGAWRQAFDPTYDSQAELEAQNAADVVVDDRRRGVSIGVLHGHDEMDENIRAQDGLFGPTTFEPVAVRGDRLALVRTRAVAPSGFELVSLGVVEIDDDGRFCSWTFFDESDLVAALEELEQRHRELCGDAYTPNERLFVERSTAYRRGELDTMLGSLGAHYQVVDHTPVGFGTADAAGLRAQIDAWDASVPTVSIQAKRYVSERAILEATAIHGTTEDGHAYVWPYATVACFDRDGLIAADHAFPIEQWHEARALFDEWSQQPRSSDDAPDRPDTP